MTTNASGELTKAFLTNVETNEQVEFLFNPTEYSLYKTNRWGSTAIVGFDVPPTEFQGGQPTTLKLDLFFDTYELDEDVRDFQRDETQQSARPPTPRSLQLGKGFQFSGGH